MKNINEKIMSVVSKSFSDLRGAVYKELWNDECTTNSRSIFECVFGEKIIDGVIVLNGEVSFNNGKTYIPRNQEKVIDMCFGELENKIFNEISSTIAKEVEDKQKKTSSTSRLESIFENFSDKDHLSMVGLMGAFNQLNILDEQIELIKSIDGDKQMLIELLNEKRILMKTLSQETLEMLNKIK